MNMKKIHFLIALCGCIFAASSLSSCEDDIDVDGTYPFTVETMPVPTRLAQGETAEIRCQLKREGRFSDARYTVRYFQPDGKGILRMDDGMVLRLNDRYPLDREVFRLYYTSECADQQKIDIYFEDNDDQMFMLTFSFNNENKDDDDGDSGDDDGGFIPGIRFPVDSVIFRPVVPGAEPKK